MNVVIVGPFWFPRGTAATARTRNLALGLRDCGARVHLIAIAPPPRVHALSGKGIQEYEGITYERAAPIGAAVDGWLDAERSMPRLRRRLADRFLWFCAVGAAALAARRRLRRLIDRGDCDLVLVCDISALRMTPIVRLCRARGVTSVLDVVETTEQLGRGRRIDYWDIAYGMRKMPALFDGLTVITSGLEAFYRERGCANTLVLPSIESWPAAPPLAPTGNGTFRLTYVGAFLPRDAPEVLVEAMRLLAHRGVDVTLDLVGGYDQTAQGRRIRELYAGDPALVRAVRFLGTLGHVTLEDHLAGSDGLILTRRQARTEEMSFPTRLVEYLRFGRPVFVSEVGDIPRYLREGEVVFLEPGDPGRTAEAIAAVASRPDRGAAIGHRGREAGARAFDRKTHAARFLDFAAGLRAAKRGAGYLEPPAAAGALEPPEGPGRR
jgi:glycosyltransferase involved in cell wall biosynthesis